MGLSILSNVTSLKAQNALNSVNKKIDKTLERLSTGLKINSGKDSSVGLIQSEKLRGKISGADQAISNIQSGNSALGVAEGYLAQLTEVAQSIRDLAVQAADSTISTTTRDTLKTSLVTQMAEYRRLAFGATYNSNNLLDGSFYGKNVQAGVDESELISVTIGDARGSALGKVAIFTSQTRTATITTTTATTLDLSGPSSLTIAGISIAAGAFTSDGVSNVEATESAIAYVNAFNSYTSQTGVTAQVLQNVQTFSYATGDTIASAYHLLINGTTVKSSATAYTNSDADVANVVTLINAKTGTTGVSASQDSTNDKIILTATDGRNINVTIAGADTTNSTNVYNMTGGSNNRSSVFRGTFKLLSNSEFTITNASAEFSATANEKASIDETTTFDNISFSTYATAGTAITIIDRAIEQVQAIRTSVGALATRFDTAENELSVRKENLSSAESNIRDADVAAETANYTMQTVLQDSIAVVLAQANARMGIVLTLLEGL